MKIGLNAGHTASGAGFGAVGKIIESLETRAVASGVSSYLWNKGVEVINCTVDCAQSQGAYLAQTAELANRQNLDWFVSIHFNAGGGEGVEVYTYEGKNYPNALNICRRISSLGFKNRGIKAGNELYVIKKTKAKALLIEVCFVDTADADLYQSIGAAKVAQEIADALLEAEQSEALKEEKQSIFERETQIMGRNAAAAEQLNTYLLSKNPQALQYLHLADIFLKEGEKEGVRGDIAFCQALKETGYFKFGGDAVPEQHNYAGIGTTGGGVKGAYFESDIIGIRAQIQHLKAYATPEPLNQACVDPRYRLVTPKGKAPTVEQLSGKWAVPGYNKKKYSSLNAAMNAGESYGHEIVKHLEKVLEEGGKLQNTEIGTEHGFPTVKYGDNNYYVKILQALLETAEIKGGLFRMNGLFEENTKKSVIFYQKEKGLLQDGIVGRKTWAKLLEL